MRGCSIIAEVIGIRARPGCVPQGQRTASPRGKWGGRFCSCHGSHYDMAGRMRRGPATRNLYLRPYEFLAGGPCPDRLIADDVNNRTGEFGYTKQQNRALLHPLTKQPVRRHISVTRNLENSDCDQEAGLRRTNALEIHAFQSSSGFGHRHIREFSDRQMRW